MNEIVHQATGEIVQDAQQPQALMQRAGLAASACKEIVARTVSTIQGKRYVRAEGWAAIAVAHGCTLSARDVERVEGGFKCTGEVRRMDNGAVIASAEGFVGRDEKRWQNADEYACRSMCQTRAMSRVARSVFSHVVVMMDNNLQTTPAEEIPDDTEMFQNARPAATGAAPANGKEQARAALKAFSAKNGQPAAVAIMERIAGVKTLDAVPAAKYPEVIAALKS